MSPAPLQATPTALAAHELDLEAARPAQTQQGPATPIVGAASDLGRKLGNACIGAAFGAYFGTFAGLVIGCAIKNTLVVDPGSIVGSALSAVLAGGYIGWRCKPLDPSQVAQKQLKAQIPVEEVEVEYEKYAEILCPDGALKSNVYSYLSPQKQPLAYRALQSIDAPKPAVPTVSHGENDIVPEMTNPTDTPPVRASVNEIEMTPFLPHTDRS